jgi:DNA-3-methyladenine glycosylase II
MARTVSQTLPAADPALGRIIARLPKPRLTNTHDLFFDLMSCVLEQQIHYRSTKHTFQKLLDRAGLTTLTIPCNGPISSPLMIFTCGKSWSVSMACNRPTD